MIAKASKCDSSASLFQHLSTDGELGTGSKARAFSNELYKKVPNKRKAVQEKRLAERSRVTNADLLMQSQSYGLLEDDAAPAPAAKKKKRKKEKSDKPSKKSSSEPKEKESSSSGGRKRNIRRRADDGSDSDDGATGVLPSTLRERRMREEARAVPEPLSMEAQAREEDKRERDEFAERLRERDEEKTRNTAPDSHLSKEEIAEMSRRGQVSKADGDDRKAGLDRLRVISRREYLKKREDKELELRKGAISDEKYLFEGENLTAVEKREMEINKEVVDLVSERVKPVVDDGYHLPNSYQDEDGKYDSRKNMELMLDTTRYLVPSFLPSFLPSLFSFLDILPPSLPSFLDIFPSFLCSFLPFFPPLTFFLPSFLPSLVSSLPSFVPSFIPFFHP
jgi:pre-mRNA-splicing factor ATP-dependent RNA helicase DHX16